MSATGARTMTVIRRCGFFRLWLVGTLVLLIGAGLVLRPDRDAAQYLKHQLVETVESDLQTRQLFTHFRLLQGSGLALDRIASELRNSEFLTDEVLTEMIELNAALKAKAHAKDRLTLFATVGLLLPLIILELGAALIWAPRGLGVRTRAYSDLIEPFDRDDFASRQGAVRRAMRRIGRETQRSQEAKEPGLRWVLDAHRVRCDACPMHKHRAAQRAYPSERL